MKVLLATDGSPCSDEAAAILARLPHREPLEVTVLTAVSPLSTSFLSPTRQFMEQLAKEDRKLAEVYQSKAKAVFFGANATVNTILLDGIAPEVIVDYAETHDMDLIVMGAKGHSLVDRLLLGSTSDYVATHAHCSVLVYRSDGTRTSKHRALRVAIAYDASMASQHSIDELLHFDWGGDAGIWVVGVAGYSPVFDPEYGFNPTSIRNEARDALRAVSDRLGQKVDNVQFRLIESDHVAEGLVRFTEDEQMDCMVVGDTGRSKLARALLGSVSRFVLRHANCGVWITRERNRSPIPAENIVKSTLDCPNPVLAGEPYRFEKLAEAN